METARIERLLAMLLLEQIGEGQQTRKILSLSRAGFDNGEIAEAVGSTTGSVASTLYAARKGTGKSKKKRKATTKG